ncbi:cell division protein FtsZ [Aliiroseovarius halocynthiae]|uniref:Cell division protein FtsZ n=1 Tax=Aliiroseovarius halocynthiae TaxID=985055 RepID=A0A545SVI9_9RHOB|nr:cell division protein FtsZ [Aliiroseovarius halocynthiae]TQV68974.1 cell division protein FtsZ [Aliiroseovarius halocynthiae]SMR71716.1 cell division protein FtsZ [Aliiroseovarius halocynthiae]
MTLNLTMPGQEELKPRITVFGVGGAGGNAVNNMIEKELEGVEFVVANTDAQALQHSHAKDRIQMGVKVTEGLGAGARATVGAAAAEESIEQIVDHLAGAHMCFITAGMGGGTGTGAAPIIAQAARELGVLTVGVVTKPFQFEGAKRMRQAEDGVDALQKMVDTLIIIPNQNLFRLANEKTTFTEAFSMADDVLYQGVKGVTDLMVRPGLINLDFADVRAVMDEMGKAMMGTGESEGEDRAVQAAEKAIANPLLDEISLRGAKGVLINITGGSDLTLFELDEAANRIREEVDPDANIIVGSTLDDGLEGGMRVSVVATGIDASEVPMDIPVPRRSLAQPLQAPIEVEQKIEAEAPAAVAATAEVDEVVAETAEPTLFGEMDSTAGVAETDIQSSFPAEAAGGDVPPPIYQAREEETVEATPVAETRFDDEPAVAQFVAPKAPAPGTPSPEAMARLQAAVHNQPRVGQPEQPVDSMESSVPQEKARFGINSLINRMTGASAADGTVRSQPPVHSEQPVQHQAPTADPEQEKVEIPAFLRRQAN